VAAVCICFLDVFGPIRYAGQRVYLWDASNGRIIWKEAAVAKSRYFPGIFLKGLRKATKNLNHDTLCS
jgi:hypothetical protein